MNPPSAPCQCRHSIIAVDRQIEIASPNSVGSLQPAQNTFKLGGRLCAMSGYSDHRKCFPNQIQPARRAKARRRACAVSRELQQTLSRVPHALETLTGRSASNKAPAQLICHNTRASQRGPTVVDHSGQLLADSESAWADKRQCQCHRTSRWQSLR